MSRPFKAWRVCSGGLAVRAWTLHKWTLASGWDTPPCAGMDAKPTSFESTEPSVATRVLGYRLWPAILVTCLTGTGFAGLKFVLIKEIALSYDPAHPPVLPFLWMRQILDRCVQDHTLPDAVSQGLAAVLTLGVLIGYALNAPLASAWRVSRLFVLSCAGVAVGTLLTLWCNVWLVVWLVGMAYGAACAARGKAVPLLSIATGRASTQVSGFINAALLIGVLSGTVFGTVLGSNVALSSTRHYILFAFMAAATLLSLLVRPPEPRRIPFAVGMRDLAFGTITMLKQHWPLLVGGGLAWGIASAASLAVYIDAINPARLGLSPTVAICMTVFAAIGAIAGNLVSHYWGRRRHVIGSLVGLAFCVASYPHLVHAWWEAAVMMMLVGTLFAAPVNVLDARLLAVAGRDGLAGRGSTVMSLVHNVFIFLIGSCMAVPLFLGAITATEMFTVLGVAALVAGAVVARARLRDLGGDQVPVPGPTAQTIAAAPTGVAD